MLKKKDERERTSQSPPIIGDQWQKKTSLPITPTVYPYLLQFTVTDQCQKDKTSGNAQVKVHQQWLTNIKKTRRVEAYKSKSTNSDWPMSKRQDEWERKSKSPPTVSDQFQKDKMSGNAQVKVRQQWLNNVKKIRRVGEHKSMSTKSGWPVKKRQDEWKRASQSPPTVTDQSKKVKTRRTAQAKVHKQWLNQKDKTCQKRQDVLGAYKPKSTNSDWPIPNR